MIRIFRFCVLIAIAGFCADAVCDVEIEMLDAPSEVLIYGPIYVTAKINNNSSLPKAICINEGETPGWFLEKGGPDEYLVSQGAITRDSDNVIWLKPGESHIIQTQIRTSDLKPGIYEVRAVLHGNGRCYLNYLTRQTLPMIKELDLHEWRPVYECWQGKSESSIQKITIHAPETQEDILALDYIVNVRKWLPSPTTFKESYSFLKENYPSSNYTYIAGFYAGVYEQIRKSHPGNSLEPYAAMMQSLFAIFQPDKAQIDPNLVNTLPNHLRQYVLQTMEEESSRRNYLKIEK